MITYEAKNSRELVENFPKEVDTDDNIIYFLAGYTQSMWTDHSVADVIIEETEGDDFPIVCDDYVDLDGHKYYLTELNGVASAFGPKYTITIRFGNEEV